MRRTVGGPQALVERVRSAITDHWIRFGRIHGGRGGEGGAEEGRGGGERGALLTAMIIRC